QVLDDRVELLAEGVDLREERPRVVEQPLERGQALHRHLLERRQVLEEAAQVGREAVQVLQGGRELPGGGSQLRDQRVRRVSEARDARGGEAGLLQERGEGDEGLLQVVVALRRRLEDAIRLADQI